MSVAISPAQPMTAYVADAISGPSTSGNVTLIDLTSDTAGAPIAVGKNPQAVSMSPDGTTAWVVCYGSRTLVPLSTKTHVPGPAIRLPGGPYAIADASAPRRARRRQRRPAQRAARARRRPRRRASGPPASRPEPGIGASDGGRSRAGRAVLRRQPADTAEAVADAADGVDEMRACSSPSLARRRR